MKAILNHLATKKVAKHTNRNTATQLGEFLLSEGYVKTGRLLTKGKHQFVFTGSNNHWVVSYRKVEELIELTNAGSRGAEERLIQ